MWILTFKQKAKVVYAKFPEDIAQRKVLLMYPIMSKIKDRYEIYDIKYDL